MQKQLGLFLTQPDQPVREVAVHSSLCLMDAVSLRSPTQVFILLWLGFSCQGHCRIFGAWSLRQRGMEAQGLWGFFAQHLAEAVVDLGRLYERSWGLMPASVHFSSMAGVGTCTC